MGTIAQRGEQLEQELTSEPMAAPAMGSIALHGALALGIVLYGIIGGYFHGSIWGNQGSGGSIQVNLVSSALPLPADQPPNQNVLSTDTPSQAPAAPTPKVKQTVDETAIPISSKQKQAQAQKQTPPKTPPHQTVSKMENRAQYGEQAGSSMPRSAQSQGGSNGPTSVGDGDFSSRFGWYVDAINRKMTTTWNKKEVDSRTPKGARVYLVFTIRKDGTPKDVQIDRSSGSPTLDSSCIRGVQRVDTFGQLPSSYNSSTLKVSYFCEY
jgi:protein TonB